jgi:hypothetical protein
MERLSNEFFFPATRLPIQLDRDVRFFCIGSCFARSVESVLSERGYRVMSLGPEFALIDNLPSTRAAGFANKYNVPSISNALRWGIEDSYPVDAFLKDGDGLWVDPHAHTNVPAATFERVVERRTLLNRIMGRVRDSDVMILTLGISEVWFDCETDLYLNMAPPKRVVDAEPARFVLRVLDYAETMFWLERAVELLRLGNPAGRVVITVSPVAMRCTFTGDDVVVANSYSKSVLRAAAAEMCARDDNLHYFPSFEIAHYSRPDAAWSSDRAHVSSALINVVTSHFVASAAGD